MVSVDDKGIILHILLLQTDLSTPETMFGSFDIKDNLNISGSISSELGKLSSLQYLNIGKIGVDDDRVNFFSYCVVVSQFEL